MFGDDTENQERGAVSPVAAAILCTITLGIVVGMAAFVTRPRPARLQRVEEQPYKRAA
jgi:hypothetical protein